MENHNVIQVSTAKRVDLKEVLKKENSFFSSIIGEQVSNNLVLHMALFSVFLTLVLITSYSDAWLTLIFAAGLTIEAFQIKKGGKDGRAE